MSRFHSLRPVRTFVPNLEGLEERTLLSTAQVVGDLISIRGTNHTDRVQIVDEGNLATNQQIRVFCEGHLAATANATQIRAIQFQHMGRGNDVVEYDLTGALSAGLPGSSRQVLGKLGSGTARFTANVNANLQSASLSLRVSGGTGKDTLELIQKGSLFGTARLGCQCTGGARDSVLTFVAPAGVDNGIGTSENISLQGGRGRDQIGMSYSGNLDGALSLTADGGLNRDVIVAVVALDAKSGTNLGAGVVPGSLNVKEMGDAANDNLTLDVSQQASNMVNLNAVHVGAQIDGGDGSDSFHASPGVAVTNVEQPV
jgi:hypothetical protein